MFPWKIRWWWKIMKERSSPALVFILSPFLLRSWDEMMIMLFLSHTKVSLSPLRSSPSSDSKWPGHLFSSHFSYATSHFPQNIFLIQFWHVHHSLHPQFLSCHYPHLLSFFCPHVSCGKILHHPVLQETASEKKKRHEDDRRWLCNPRDKREKRSQTRIALTTCTIR